MFTASCRLGILVFFLSLKDIPLSASAKKKMHENTHMYICSITSSPFPSTWRQRTTAAPLVSPKTNNADQKIVCHLGKQNTINPISWRILTCRLLAYACRQRAASQITYWRQNFPCLAFITPPQKNLLHWRSSSITHSNLWNLHYNYTKILNSKYMKSQLLIEMKCSFIA